MYEIGSSGSSSAQADALGNSLGITGVTLDANGAIQYLDPNRFLSVPTTVDTTSTPPSNEEGTSSTLTTFDMNAIRNLTVMSNDQALSQTRAALQAANILGSLGPVTATPDAGHTRFRAVDSGSTVLADSVPIDTQVNYSFQLDGHPLIGPGAAIGIVFAPDGTASRAHVAWRDLTQGKDVPIISSSKATTLARQAFEPQAAAKGALTTLQLSDPELVYYAPDLSFHVDAIYPYYRVGGTVTVDGHTLDLPYELIPAAKSAPNVDVSVSVDPTNDYQVTATAKINGGTPPYSFEWSTNSTQLDSATATSGPTIQYSSGLYDRAGNKLGSELVHVQVTDANGMVVEGSNAVSLQALGAQASSAAPQRLKPMVAGTSDVGAEWMSSCPSHALPHTGVRSKRFLRVMSNNGANIGFEFGNNNAWETDFKDPSKTGNGNDTKYADNVDWAYFADHGNPNGFLFCSKHDDTWMGHNEADWGNTDLEWLTVSACELLQRSAGSGSWWQRWGPAFDGLHLLMGYATVSYDNRNGGRVLARRALGKGWFHSPLAIRQAWALAAKHAQPHKVVWSVMGVLGSNNWADYNDHYWGYGNVGPDLRGSDKKGYWIIWGPS